LNTFCSVIIPVFNGIQVLTKCLESLAAQTHTAFEVLIVNNDSRFPVSLSGFPETLRINLLHSDTNRFYAEAVNHAYSKSRGKLILVMNSDVVLDRDFLRILVRHFDRRFECFCAHGLMLGPNGRIDSIGVIPGYTLRPVDRKNACSHPEAGPSGAAFVLRKETCQKLIRCFGNLMDPEISFYYSDLSLAFRLKQLGIRSDFLPAAFGTHFRGASTPIQSSVWPFRYFHLTENYQKLLMRNRSIFLRKWFSWKRDFWRFPFVAAYSWALKTVHLLQRFHNRFWKIPPKSMIPQS